MLIWHKLFNWLGKFLNNRWLRLYGITLILLGVYGWGVYLPFTQGWLPGAHWPAAAYDTAFPYVGFVLLLGIILGWAVVAIAILVLLLVSFVLPWQRARCIAAYLTCFSVLWLATFITLAPALLISYDYRNVLTIEPWGKTYRTSYVAFRLDDNYGEVMLSECDSWGWCHQLHRGYTDLYSAQAAQPSYDPNRDHMKVRINPGGYVRSRDQQLCPTEGANSDRCFYEN